MPNWRAEKKIKDRKAYRFLRESVPQVIRFRRETLRKLHHYARLRNQSPSEALENLLAQTELMATTPPPEIMELAREERFRAGDFYQSFNLYKKRRK